MAENPKPYIRAGEWIACENGHRYAKAKIDIASGATIESRNFELLDGSSPEPWKPVGLCECGARRVVFLATGFVPYIEGRGWVSPVVPSDRLDTPKKGVFLP